MQHYHFSELCFSSLGTLDIYFLCRANHPHATVYNQCSNLLLKHAIEEFGGQKPKALSSLDMKNSHKLSSMPMPGDVDFIYGGMSICFILPV